MSDETKARIAEIEARERAATLGPWRDITDSIAAQVDADKSFGCTCTAIERAGVDGLGGEIVGIGWYDGPVLTLRAGDATFIAHARADVPWLLERLAAETKRADEAEREQERLVEREAYFANALHVADGGQYRADWPGAIRRVLAERDAAIARAERAEKELAEARADRDVAESRKSEAFHRLHARAAAAESSLAAHARVVDASRRYAKAVARRADGHPNHYAADRLGELVEALAALPADEGGVR